MKNHLKPLLTICVVASAMPAFAETTFDRLFAPQDGLVSSYEQPARAEICLNGSWKFQGDQSTEIPDGALPQLGEWDKTAIKIPSPWNVNAFSMGPNEFGGDFRAYPSYPKEWESLPAAWMEKTVNVPKNWTDKRIVLRFGAVGGRMVVFVNGKRIGEGFDIFFPQEYDVTDAIKLGAENQILVKVVSSRSQNKRGRYGSRDYLAGSFWGQFVSGIWQDVFLLAQPKIATSDIFVQSWVDKDELKVETTVTNTTGETATVDVSAIVREWVNQTGKSTEETPEVKWELGPKNLLKLSASRVKIEPGTSQTVTLSAKVNGSLKLWSPDAPNLNGLLLTVSVNGKKTDVKYQRFGWRQFTIDGNKFLLNGQPITLRGDSWHFMGVPQMTRRYAYAWYRLLHDAGANAVRLHASIYPSFYHDMADEMGVMILDESAIWASDGGPKADSDLFWTNCRAHVAELVKRDRNHPSVYGWSICNEILPVLRNVWHTPQNMVDHCLDEMVAWKDICIANDPTRQWISGDGEEDANGRLPIINIHYGGDGEMRRAQESGKPWGVGETSMAYYGTPKQVSQFNGNRAYESPLGRMEGLAYECYGLLTAEQKYGANYQSVFNIVWYGVQPLPFGKSDLTKAPNLDEGIFFGKFKEGVPGMQPERIGPYVSTLNPGYDPKLPLYRPWPMFDAIHDANKGVTDSPWAQLPPKPSPPPSANTNGTAALAYLAENGGALAQKLARSGAKTVVYSPDAKTDFLLIDGSSEPNAIAVGAIKAAADKVLGQGGTVWVWDIRPQATLAMSKIFDHEITVAPRVASSFVVKQDDALLVGLDNAALYFSEGDDWQQISYALDGDFLKGGQVVLNACPVDWRRWSYRSEQVKTASIFRSQVENPGPLAEIAIRAVGKGRVILCNLNPEIRSSKKSAVMQRLFSNEGIQIEKLAAQGGFMDAEGHLMRALVCGSFPVTNMDEAYTGKLPNGEVREGGRFDGRHWSLHDADRAGVFDLKNGMVRGEQENAYAYIAVWIKSSKPLNDLLSEPNLPKLVFTYGADDGCEVYLNGELLSSHRREGPLEPEVFSENPLLLKLGWNQLVVKVVQIGGNWQFAGKFACSDSQFLQKLEFATEMPQ
jgi:beta-galactosidase